MDATTTCTLWRASAISALHGLAIDKFLAATLGLCTLDDLEESIRRDANWPEFCAAAVGGEIKDSWLDGLLLGRLIVSWAKEAA